MDYNNLNNFLQNLDLENKKNNDIYNKKIETDFNTYNNNNQILSDNKNIVLQRELGLNNNINYNVEIANPQRCNNVLNKRGFDESNQKLNNYNFNPYSNIHKNNTIDISQNFNINTKKIIDNKINNKINERDKIPEKSFKCV
jgi:hypothetical protein